jgi:hypothetical protein
MSLSTRSIGRLFKIYLNKAPEIAIKSKGNVHLLIDGSYLPNGLCLILYYDHDIRYVQLYRTGSQEKFREIHQDLQTLKKLGINIYSATCDGHKAILKAIRKAFPDAIIQRCLVHIKRQVRHYLSSRPKLQASKELLYISQKITSLHTEQQCALWLISLHNWYHNYQPELLEESINPITGKYWYTHKDLHAAWSLIANALPHMFAYLQDHEIPATTNRLENFFRHLKAKLLLHSGLRLEAKRSFIKWYLHFKNNPDK